MVLCQGCRRCPPTSFLRMHYRSPGSWKWGVPVKEKKNINDLLAALQTLKDWGVKGSGIIGAYHARRVAPLMARVLPLHQMVPGASFKGKELADEALHPSEVAQRIKEAMEPSKDTAGVILDFVFLRLFLFSDHLSFF